MRTRTWILIAAGTLAAAVGMAAAGVAVWQADRDRQPNVVDSIAAMDGAVTAALTSAGDQAAVAVAGMVRSSVCQVGMLRHDGGTYTRAADLYTDPATADTLLSRISDGLATHYDVRVGGVQTLNADIGQGVHLRVSRLGEGWFTVQASTGCVIGPDPGGPNASVLSGQAAQTIDALLSRLGTSAAETHIDTVDCSQGGIGTAVAISESTDSSNLAARLQSAVPAGARVYPTTSNRLAYREGLVSVIVAASDDATAATVRYTQPC